MISHGTCDTAHKDLELSAPSVRIYYDVHVEAILVFGLANHINNDETGSNLCLMPDRPSPARPGRTIQMIIRGIPKIMNCPSNISNALTMFGVAIEI